jgi:hypothetical protein
MPTFDKDIAVHAIVMALQEMDESTLRKIADDNGIDLDSESNLEVLRKADLVDDDGESLTAMAKRNGNPHAIDLAMKLEALAKRIDEMKGTVSYDPTPANNLRKLDPSIDYIR